MEGKSVVGLKTEGRKYFILATFLRENRALPAMPVTSHRRSGADTQSSLLFSLVSGGSSPQRVARFLNI